MAASEPAAGIEPTPTRLRLLGPVLELAVVVAQTGSRAHPPIAPPPLLRPYTNFTRRIPTPALRAAWRVLNEDVELRARVASVVTDELVGRAGVLFAARPEGWEADLAALVAEAGTAADSDVDHKADRAMARRLEGAQSAARRAQDHARRADEQTRRAEESLARARADLVGAQAQLADERRRSATLEAAAGREESQVRELRTAVEAARVHSDGQARALADVSQQRRSLDAEVTALRADLARRRDLEAAIARAEQANEHLRLALNALRMPAPAPEGAQRPRRVRGARHEPARRPSPLPPATFADSVEAAAYLLRLPDVVVLVDGYNVSKYRWGDLTAGEQRARLVSVLGELAARTGAEMHVVFDGAEGVGPAPVPVIGRRPVRVTFSPPDVEADDVLIEMVATVPDERPVVVVSSDRRVQLGVSAHGGNVLATAQFVSAWGPARFLSHPPG